ncbi:hypothetical protein [Burkholderia vietnamiensis]|nr:hypothetical protein [Burkholderia vietnamiensis]MBR8205288.1 hypothetical protein [Burkholderia vietnamiensis]
MADEPVVIKDTLSGVSVGGAAASGDGSTAIGVRVMRAGRQEVLREVLMRDGGTASFGAEAVFPVGHVRLDGPPVIETVSMKQGQGEDFAGSWNLVIKQVTFDAEGNAAVQASLDEHAPGATPEHQDVALSIKAGEHATIHGANGKDYLLSIHHVVSQAG